MTVKVTIALSEHEPRAVEVRTVWHSGSADITVVTPELVIQPGEERTLYVWEQKSLQISEVKGG